LTAVVEKGDAADCGRCSSGGQRHREQRSRDDASRAAGTPTAMGGERDCGRSREQCRLEASHEGRVGCRGGPLADLVQDDY
jgi:hypothetical protein